MIVNEKSWHMRLNRWWSPSYVPRDLCSYFWRTLAMAMLAAAAVLLAPVWIPVAFVHDWWDRRNESTQAVVENASLAVLLTLFAGMLITAVTVLIIENGWIPFLRSLGIAVGAVLGGILLLGGLSAVVDWIEGRSTPRSPKPSKPKSDPLIRSFISAKKRRICPIIETQDASGRTVGVGGKRKENTP